jgi:uncharacterized protein YndB with AHSA1/START domain
MSNSYRALITFVFLLAIGAAATMTDDFKADAGRIPASIHSKSPISGEGPLSSLRHTSKISPPLDVVMELDGSKPEKPGDTFVIHGRIHAVEDLERVDFKWSIPEDVDVINGEGDGQLTRITGGQDVSLQLTLKTRTGENHQIHLTAGVTVRGSRFSNTAQYNTLVQDLLNASREQLRQSTETQAKEDVLNSDRSHQSRESEFKVFQ